MITFALFSFEKIGPLTEILDLYKWPTINCMMILCYFFLCSRCGFIRIGIVVGIGATMVRESSAVMLGHYFKRRRQFVEMITMSGEGVGIALFSVILKEGIE